MPRSAARASWSESLQADVKALAVGWSVKERKGKVFLRVRQPDQPEVAVTLPFEWIASSKGDAYTRVRNIFKLVGEGYSLKQAALVADGKAPKRIEQQDWSGSLERFKQQKLSHGTVIKLATWEAKYQPVLSNAVALLTGRQPPTTPAELIDRCIRAWDPGSRTRQERARNLAQFLRYCVAREQVPAIWQPPIDLKDAIGRKPADARSQKSNPITDQQIINLIASIPDDPAGHRWADVIRLMAELGLRPVELLHLSVRIDPTSGEPYWWCSYEKRSGGGVTEPRRLYPLPLQGDDREVEQWNLLLRWKAGLIELPSLRSGNGAADAIATYLNRREGWRSLRAQLEGNGQRLSCYSFRHGYSVRGHQRGIDNGSMALAMGHSIEVHCRSYPWATDLGAAAAFARAEQRVGPIGSA
ncbi:MAG: site-specific integrase [Cyanobacteriota bacterium]|nr:site-specific integrase [Cyanobacteriota bacterium]